MTIPKTLETTTSFLTYGTRSCVEFLIAPISTLTLRPTRWDSCHSEIPRCSAIRWSLRLFESIQRILGIHLRCGRQAILSPSLRARLRSSCKFDVRIQAGYVWRRLTHGSRGIPRGFSRSLIIDRQYMLTARNLSVHTHLLRGILDIVKIFSNFKYMITATFVMILVCVC